DTSRLPVITLFPYTTLFRSLRAGGVRRAAPLRDERARTARSLHRVACPGLPARLARPGPDLTRGAPRRTALQYFLVLQVARGRPADERHTRNLSVQEREALAELHGERHLHHVALTLEDCGKGDHHLLDEAGVGVDAQLLREEAFFHALQIAIRPVLLHNREVVRFGCGAQPGALL